MNLGIIDPLLRVLRLRLALADPKFGCALAISASGFSTVKVSNRVSIINWRQADLNHLRR